MYFRLVIVFSWCLISFNTIANEPSPDESMAGFCTQLPRPEYTALKRVRLESPELDYWFELYQVAPGVTAIYEPHQWQEVISYLIEGTDKALLFDTGNGIGDIAAVVSTLTDKPIEVLNSHGHYDHVGGNYAFSVILGLNTEFTNKRTLGHSNEQIKIEVSPAALCKPAPAKVTQSNHVGKPYTITQRIQDGSKIDLGKRILEVLHIPGHTPDSIVLVDRTNGLMWTGDSYYSGPIWLHAPETDLTAYRKSLARLIEESKDIKALLPAHNTPWVKPEVLTRVAIQFDQMLAGKLVRIDQGEGMIEYRSAKQDIFSFLMRDEPLPYRKSK